MLYIIITLLVFAAPVLSERVRYEGYKVIEVIPATNTHLEALHQLFKDAAHTEVDVWRPVSAIGRPVQVSLSPHVFNKYTQSLRVLGLKPVINIDNVQALIDQQQRTNKPGLETAATFDYGKYHELEEVNTWLKDMNSAYPSITTLFNIASSYEGREITAIKISTSKGSGSKPGFFMEGGIHAREWISPATVIYMTGQLLDGYGTNPNITDLVDKFDWYILPVFNVDGYQYTMKTDRNWRKTRSKNKDSPCYGVDPNRNWDMHWCEKGASKDPCSDAYCGPSPFSEVEVRNVSDFIKNAKNMKVFIDFHSFSELWMTPYGYKKQLPVNYTDIDKGAEIAVEALQAVNGVKYEHGSIANIIYVASGSSADWTYGVAGIEYSYGVELRDKGQYGFLLPVNQIIPSGKETFAAVEALANYVYKNL